MELKSPGRGTKRKRSRKKCPPRFPKHLTKIHFIRALVILVLCLISGSKSVPVTENEGGIIDSASCNPLLCLCSSTSANCSRRGFLALPSGLPESLEYLDLSHNDLISVNASDFQFLSSLHTADLSNNEIKDFFGGSNQNLKILDLSYNNITSVRSLQLAEFPQLRELNLASNKILSMPSNAFNGLSPKLRILNLRNNKIVNLEPGCLDNLKNLEELILTKNGLSSFPKGVFEYMKKLKVLELNKNKFADIQGLSFHGLDNLEILKLKRNQIEYLMDGAFFGLKKIRELHLDRNKVKEVSKGWLYGLTTLETLILSHNKVDYIWEDAWEFCKVLFQLDLRGNSIQLLDNESFRRLPQLKILNLKDNKISHIDDQGTFDEVPVLEVLLLDGNEFSHTIEDMSEPFKGLDQLKELSLSRNQIKSIGKEAFLGMKNLVRIDLRDNVISTLQENPFENLPLLKTIYIDSSSILCDCYLKWFPRFLEMTGIEGCSATCAHPENLKGHELTKIPYENYTCDDFPKPYILKQPETQITLRGSDLTLYCRAASTSPADMTFEWRIDSDILHVDSGENCTGRCITYKAHSFDGKGREITSELRLTNLTHDDAGKYQCIVSNKYGATYSDRANITVYVYPTFMITPEDITVEAGASAALECGGKGVPPPNVKWSKDSNSDFPAARERRIREKSRPFFDKRININSFIIQPVKAVDMGIYTCSVSNPAGKITYNITLSVLEIPKFVKPMENKTVPEGETAVIECMASGSPKPKLTWKKDGGLFQATERHFFTADNQLLIIVKARPQDAGIYECTMHNQLGTERQSSLLRISDPIVHASLINKTTIIIVIAIVCCVAGTSLVWMCFIRCNARRKRRNAERLAEHDQYHDEENRPLNFPVAMDMAGEPGLGEFDIAEHVRIQLAEGKRAQNLSIDSIGAEVPNSGTETTCLTTLGTEDLEEQEQEEKESEKDSGTGDSKRSNDNVDEDEDFQLMDAAYHLQEAESLVNDRLRTLVAKQGGGEDTASLSEFENTLHVQKGNRGSKAALAIRDGGGDSSDNIPFADEDSSSNSNYNSRKQRKDTDSSSSAATKEGVASANNKNKTKIKNLGNSDSDSKQKDLLNVSDIPFRTFHPKKALTQSSYELDRSTSSANLRQNNKRASTIDVNGECYMAIEPEVDRSSVLDIDQVAYRGGCGTLPRHSLDYEQALLEASLNDRDILECSRNSYARNPNRHLSRERTPISSARSSSRHPRSSSASRSALFGGKKNSNFNSLPRRRSGKYKNKAGTPVSSGTVSANSAAAANGSSASSSNYNHLAMSPEHSAVATKSKDMFI